MNAQSILRSTTLYTLLCVATIFIVMPADAATLQVGPGKPYTMPCPAIAAAQNGDVVEIAAGEYLDQSCGVYASITIRGVGTAQGGRAWLHWTKGTSVGMANGKGILNPAASQSVPVSVILENIELSGARVVSNNGAGVRVDPNCSLRCTNCYIHDNQMGILSGDGALSKIEVVDSIIDNSHFDGYPAIQDWGHGIYVGGSTNASTLIVRHSIIRGTHIGHNIKSRAKFTNVLYSLIDDWSGDLGRWSDTSYSIEAPQGGTVLIQGNLIRQGSPNPTPATWEGNWGVIGVGDEAPYQSSSSVTIKDNTLINARSDGGVWSYANPDFVTAWTITGNRLMALSATQPGAATFAAVGMNTTLPWDASYPIVLPADPGGGITPPTSSAITWSLVSGVLPPGLSLSLDGLLSGSPTTSGTYTFIVRASSSAASGTATADKTFSVTISSPPPPVVVLNITTTSPLPGGVVGTAYSVQLNATLS